MSDLLDWFAGWSNCSVVSIGIGLPHVYSCFGYNGHYCVQTCRSYGKALGLGQLSRDSKMCCCCCCPFCYGAPTTDDRTHAPVSIMHRRLPTACIEVAPHYHQLLVVYSVCCRSIYPTTFGTPRCRWCCLHTKPFFLFYPMTSDIISTPSVLHDSSSERYKLCGQVVYSSRGCTLHAAVVRYKYTWYQVPGTIYLEVLYFEVLQYEVPGNWQYLFFFGVL